MYRVLEQVSKKMYPGVTVLPSMSTGSSDKAQLRAKGQQSYGFGPAGTREDFTNYGAHRAVDLSVCRVRVEHGQPNRRQPALTLCGPIRVHPCLSAANFVFLHWRDPSVPGRR
jgi:hypothetical protein